MTQMDVAERLKISFQAVSKWENGTLPNVEMLVELAKLLQVSVDEILNGEERKKESTKAGIQGLKTENLECKKVNIYHIWNGREIKCIV